jgi:hypothetical protein
MVVSPPAPVDGRGPDTPASLLPCTRRSVTAMPVAGQILCWASVSIVEGGRRYNQFLDPLV